MRSSPITDTNENGFEVSDDPQRIDGAAAHAFLSKAYWSEGIPAATLREAIENSWCFGLFAPAGAQIGFARLITDYATYAYLADVYVLPEYRGQGLASWLMEAVFAQPATRDLRRIMLATRDAHKLYKKVGFTPLAKPEIFMEISRPESYRSEGNL